MKYKHIYDCNTFIAIELSCDMTDFPYSLIFLIKYLTPDLQIIIFLNKYDHCRVRTYWMYCEGHAEEETLFAAEVVIAQFSVILAHRLLKGGLVGGVLEGGRTVSHTTALPPIPHTTLSLIDSLIEIKLI